MYKLLLIKLPLLSNLTNEEFIDNFNIKINILLSPLLFFEKGGAC